MIQELGLEYWVKGDCQPVTRALVVLAEYPGESRERTLWRVCGGDVFWDSVAYPIGKIGIIGRSIPGTEN